MNVAVIKYNAGNIYSVVYALKRLGIEPVVTADEETLQKADRIIFPGQGEASKTMRYLKDCRFITRSLKALNENAPAACSSNKRLCANHKIFLLLFTADDNNHSTAALVLPAPVGSTTSVLNVGCLLTLFNSFIASI